MAVPDISSRCLKTRVGPGIQALDLQNLDRGARGGGGCPVRHTAEYRSGGQNAGTWGVAGVLLEFPFPISQVLLTKHSFACDIVLDSSSLYNPNPSPEEVEELETKKWISEEFKENGRNALFLGVVSTTALKCS